MQHFVSVFQLTASRRGWLAQSITCGGRSIFQLTASRRGWPPIQVLRFCPMFISTHSLTKRLTVNKHIYKEDMLFQLTASRRGWRRLNSLFRTWTVFQLTASRRGWPVCNVDVPQINHFNSQPHEEADGGIEWERFFLRHFNSQPHEEADHIPFRASIHHSHFNSQPHEEADELILVFIMVMKYFNSQPHEEADRESFKRNRYSASISTHSLTKRLTRP